MSGHKGRLAAAGIIAIGLGIAGTTGAVAGVMVTSADIKDGTIKARDIGESAVGWRGELTQATRDKIASLAGQDGAPGAAGADGAAGANGADGSSAYEIWAAQPDNAANDADGDGTPATESDFLASLVGPPGEQGPAGVDGQKGADGSSVTSFTFSYNNKNYTCTDPEGDGSFACDTTPPGQ